MGVCLPSRKSDIVLLRRDPAKKSHSLVVTVTKDELTTTDEKGKVSRFKQAR